MAARLSVESGSALPGSVQLQPPQSIYLGRHRKKNHVVLTDEHVSRRHAEIFHQDNHWFLRDFNTKNGTHLNGLRIQETVALEHGAQIMIGKIRLRFTMEGHEPLPNAVVDVTPFPTTPVPVICQEEPGEEMETSLHVDELQTLVTFLNDSLRETSADQLVKRALTMVRQQTGADVSGFLGLDPEDPLPRLLLPAQGELDGNLSKKLTNLMKQTNQSVWMAKDERKTSNSDSLAGFTDALCIPIRSAEAKNPGEAALGALHAYKYHGIFTERQVQFCEALAGSLANGLRSLRTRRVLEADNSRLRFRSPNQSDRLIGGSKQMERLRSDIARLADCPCTVLIIGESGVGKELVAEDLHHQSSRREGPLVPVNCGAIAASMAESELFGHEMGAFTNAIRTRPGYFRDADEGTLFLDEIGELSTECQAMMLRVLESRRVRPVGSDREIAVDVRLVAATNRDLPKESREGRFRSDLYYRLGTVITVPPLRDHLEDIPELARHFLAGFAALYKRHTRLSESALKRLMSYTWPGNVRQLRTVLETAVAMTSEELITEADLRLTPDLPAPKQLPSLNLEELETMAIRQALEQTRMNNTHAARLLGIHRETLINKLKKIDGGM